MSRKGKSQVVLKQTFVSIVGSSRHSSKELKEQEEITRFFCEFIV